MNREYIIYEGRHFTIEWYFSDNGKSQPLEYFNNIGSSNQRKLLYLIKRIGDFDKAARPWVAVPADSVLTAAI